MDTEQATTVVTSENGLLSTIHRSYDHHLFFKYESSEKVSAREVPL